jgi:CheY-like chemotaxis protein
LNEKKPAGIVLVLVVEDEPFLLLQAMDIVEDAGFTAIAANNAEKAIEILEARNDIRIVFTDIDMPGSMDGIKLAIAIRKRWPPVHLIVTSGHYRESPAGLPSDARFYAKPYETETIINALHSFS